jgi:hypothetical protein
MSRQLADVLGLEWNPSMDIPIGRPSKEELIKVVMPLNAFKPGDKGHLGHQHSEEFKASMRGEQNVAKRDEVRKKNSDWHLEHQIAKRPEVRALQSLRSKERGARPPVGSFKGHKHSEATRKAHSERMKGRIPWNKGIITGPRNIP